MKICLLDKLRVYVFEDTHRTCAPGGTATALVRAGEDGESD